MSNEEMAIDYVKKIHSGTDYGVTMFTLPDDRFDVFQETILKALEKQIPKSPGAYNDHTWGIARRQRVCPVCGADLDDVRFFFKGDRVFYCWCCGQAIGVKV